MRADKEELYEEALYTHLHDTFPSENFQRQYWQAKTRADIYVEFKGGARVVVEVKRDLRDRADLHRVIGQTWEYLAQWKNVEVVVVVCGASDPALVKLLRQAVSYLGGPIDRKVKVVEKSVVKAVAAAMDSVVAG